MRQESENRGSGDRKPKYAGGALAAAGIVAALAVAYCAREQDNSSQTEPTIEPTTITRQLETPSSQEGSLEVVRSLFQQTNDLNQSYFDNRRQGKSQEELRNDSNDLTISKVRAMWATSHFPEDPFLKNDGNVVIFNNGRQFDLTKPNDFVVGTALVDYFFDSMFEEELQDEIGFWFDSQRLQSYEGFNNIFWLVDNLQIEMGDIPPVARTESLEKLTQGLRFMQEAGMPIPTKAKIQYFGLEQENIYKNVDEDTLLLQVYSFPDGDFRTETSLTDYIIARTLNVLSGYKEKVSAAFNTNGDQVTEPRLLSSSEYGYIYDDEGELPQVLSDYIYDGISFRKRIAYAQETGHIAEANIAQAKYDYAKQVFDGIETSVDGRKQEVLSYNVGDVIEIADYDDFARPGIFLRETPTLEIDPNRPVVYDGWKVKLVEGPVIYLDEINLEATRIWKIQEGDFANDRIFVGDEARTGWISEEWFGEKLLPDN